MSGDSLSGAKNVVEISKRFFKQLAGIPGSVASVGKITEGVAAISCLPGACYGLLSTKELSRSTLFGIKDLQTGFWLIRFDKAHKGVNYAHININWRLTGVRDPHTKVPNAVVSTLGWTGQVLRAVNKVALYTCVAVDTYRLGSDVKEDLLLEGQPGKRTAKTAASISGGLVGGLTGAAVGNKTGAIIGWTVGWMFFGMGAVPGAAIGSLLGTAVGGVMCSIHGSHAAESVVETLVSNKDQSGEEMPALRRIQFLLNSHISGAILSKLGIMYLKTEHK